ncbi:Serpin (serine protease inhibitor) [Oceanobacillus oncorhynchi]|uniref:Serpin (Serine protease inhibitor) n=1 Tax=Oceanobacillus oncorhynchi TaxID=545501 RepID=A0A0A1ML30_9BACI|nr:serpin family protein [Oceanobacillus oncorhynchi]CEI80574.1 Serpin (serine protease inhibitor) [Oceanobacillus oncorhynchi]
MMKKLLCLCIVLILTACNSSDSEENPSPADIESPDDASKETVQAGLNQLGFEALSGLDKNEDGNVFISPISIWTALNMTYHGADGKTKAEMEEVLGLENIDSDALLSADHDLLMEQAADNQEVELYLANAVWFREDMEINAAYQEALETYYQAKIDPLTTADAINDWVAEQTNDRIDHMADDISPDLILFLLNAVYFQGDWTYPFDETLTEEQEFSLEDGSTIETPMMTLYKKDLYYWEDENVQVVSLPYEEEETIQMQIFLPSEDTSFSNFREDFSLEKWQESMDALEQQTGTVLLPSFTLEYESELNDFFIHLGMEQAFDPNQADLSNMFEGTNASDAYISRIFHKTFIDVDEEGTEAAGATSVEVEETSAVLEDTFTMNINRPFLFTITNTEEDIILFMGSIEQPVQE